MERAGLLGGVQLRHLQPDENNRLRGETLEKAIREDREAGLIPFYVSFTFLIFLHVQFSTLKSTYVVAKYSTSLICCLVLNIYS